MRQVEMRKALIDAMSGCRTSSQKLQHVTVERDRALKRIEELEQRISFLVGNHIEEQTKIGDEDTVELGKLFIDFGKKVAKWDRRFVRLGRAEFAIITKLVSYPDRVFSRSDILGVIDPECKVGDRALDSRIKHIRAKFRAVDPDFDKLATAYGLGYFWSDEVPPDGHRVT